jgi:hypothetical protein
MANREPRAAPVERLVGVAVVQEQRHARARVLEKDAGEFGPGVARGADHRGLDGGGH